MFAVVQEVHLVGGDPWWHAPLIAAAVALVVAVIAAYTANRRQKVQLQHDLFLNYREETRDIIDGAAITAVEVLRSLTQLEKTIHDREGELEKAKEVIDVPESERPDNSSGILKKAADANQAVRARLDSAADKNEELDLQVVRLSLRMGFKAGAVEAYKCYRQACIDRTKYIDQFYEPWGLKKANSTELERLEEAQTGRLAKFYSECDVWYEEGRKGLEGPVSSWKLWRRRRLSVGGTDPDAPAEGGPNFSI